MLSMQLKFTEISWNTIELLRYRLSTYLSPFCKLCGKTIFIIVLKGVLKTVWSNHDYHSIKGITTWLISVHGRYGGSDFQDLTKRKRPQRFLSKAFDKKKGGYLLSRIALFDTVYHRCMDSMVAAIFKTTQNEKDLRDFSPRSSLRKKAATYSPTLPYLTRCTIGVWTIR